MADTEEIDSFPPEIADAVDGLMWLGHLETEVVRWGHSWVLRTLKGGEELEVALVAKEYIDTYGQVKANVWATLAAALVEVDGEENFCPAIGPSRKDHVRAKVNFIIDNWYWPTAEMLYGEYGDLIRRQGEALAALEDLSARSLHSSWPSEDSSTEAGDSEATSTPSNSES